MIHSEKPYKMDWISRDRIRIDPSLHFRIEPKNERSPFRTGSILPILVFPHEDQFILIDGFRRFSFLSPDVSTVPVLIWQGDLLPGILEGIKLNYTTHPFEIIEEIRIIQYLSENGYSPEMIKKEIPEIRAPITAKYLNQFGTILRMPHSLLYYFKKSQASFKQIIMVSSFPIEVIEVVLSSLPLSEIKLKDFLEILNYMETVRQRDGIDEVREYAKSLFDKTPEKEGNRSSWWKAKWKEIAYPQLYTRLRELETLRESTEKTGFQINFDRNVEDRSISMQFKINQISDLDQWIKRMQDDKFKSKVRKMLEILHS